jgi:hypothetical protein
MRSPSEPEPSESREHALLDFVESGVGRREEKKARLDLLEESERNIRGGHFPDLYPRRLRNMQVLFDLLRTERTSYSSSLWLEARLLRLMERHDQCRQLCQGEPMYNWTFPALREFVWASRADSFPYDRSTDFQNEGDAKLAAQLFEAAKTMHEAKCYQWQQAHDEASKPNDHEDLVSWRNGGLFLLVMVATAAGWYFLGWQAALVAFVGGSMLLGMLGDENELIKERMAQWCSKNPRPQMHLRRGFSESAPVGGGFPDIA